MSYARPPFSSANTVLDDLSVAQLLTEMVRKGEDTSKVKAWLHSHGTLNTFWSATDEDCITNLANSNYVISLVTNKPGSILARADIVKPFHVSVNEVAVEVYHPESEELRAICKAEFKEKVSETLFVPSAIWDRPFPGEYESNTTTCTTACNRNRRNGSIKLCSVELDGIRRE